MNILLEKQQQHDIKLILAETWTRKNPSIRWDLNPLDHGGSWVQIPSGVRIFPSLRFS